jgi:hypothetical protein
MMTTLIPNTRDGATSTIISNADVTTTETPSVIDFGAATKERPAFFERMPRRWGLIAGAVGGSIALASAATLFVNAIVRRRAQPRRFFGVRPIRRFGVRHLEAPRGGAAWLAYIYRTPDLRVRLPIRK